MTRASTPTDPAAAEAIGEIRGQLREIIHGMNNDRQRNEAIARALAKLENVPDDIGEVKKSLNKLEGRMTALEVDKHRRDGAMSFGTWLMKSPLVAWLAAAALVLWTWLKDNGQ